MRGPASAQGEPQLGTVRVSRFESQRCGACMVVVPPELLPRRLYTASAIGLALALWSLMGGTEATTRKRVSPFAIVGAAAASRWMTLRRWAHRRGYRAAVRNLPRTVAGLFRRHHAERAAAALVALAPAGLPLEQAAFAGGALHAR